MVVGECEVAYYRGRKAWKDGNGRPSQPADDDPCVSPEAWFWIGYMTARGADYMERIELAEKLGGDPESVQPVG